MYPSISAKKNLKFEKSGGSVNFWQPPYPPVKEVDRKTLILNSLLFAQVVPTKQASAATAHSQNTATGKRKRSSHYRYRQRLLQVLSCSMEHLNLEGRLWG